VEELPGLAISTAAGDVVVFHDAGAVTEMGGFLTPSRDEVVGSHSSRPGETTIEWRAVPSGELAATATLGGDLHLTAISSSGTLAALTDATPGGTQATSDVIVVDRNRGELGRWTLTGNLVPEAFANASVPEGNGMSIGVFVIEYLASGAYRVRVIDTASGEVGLPLNLRDKSQTVDEEIHAVSRSSVFDPARQLLFTLYRGTTDDMPGDDSFIHTLGLINGVWCLAVPHALELTDYDGALAVSSNGRLYAASANGTIAGYSIDDITDVEATPIADIVAEVAPASGTTVSIAADHNEVVVSVDDTVYRLDPTTLAVRDSFTWSGAVEAVALVGGDVVVVGGRRIARLGPTHDVLAEAAMPQSVSQVRHIALLPES
jgi:hypothetical protein